MADTPRDPAPAAPPPRDGKWRKILRGLDLRRLKRRRAVPATGHPEEDVPLGYC